MSSVGTQSVNKIILGDNLEVLRGLPDESVDLIYLDPPFFSNRNYEVIWGDDGEVRSFKDRWAGGIEHYIAWLKERVIEMHRVLKNTGSFYLHCDWHASHYIKVEILDRPDLFGKKNFRNEIVWKRNFTKKGSQFKMTRLAANTDSIFFYSKSAKCYFATPRSANIDEQALIKIYDKIDDRGRHFKSEPLELPKMMKRDNLVFEYRGYTPKYGWMMNREKLEELDALDKIYFTSNGKPRRKNFIDDYEGTEIDNIWLDILPVGQNQSEIIGYPTQKPEALMGRIIQCSSKPGDVVLDPFCGGGTTVAVADKLGRQWIGIDQSVAAVKVTELRLNKQQDLLSEPFTVQLHKYDYDTLRSKDAFEFETWIVQQYGGMANVKQRGDYGIDGRKDDNTPIQVKRSDNIGRNVVDNFVSAIRRYDKTLLERNRKDKKTVGYIIAFSFSKGAVEEVARLKTKDGIIIELVKVEDIVPLAKKPKITAEFKHLSTDAFGRKEIELTAAGESDAGIEFYSWDFAYNAEKGFKADVIRDTKGIQIKKFDTGVYVIAVKIIDNEGLESIETAELHINGGVKRSGIKRKK